MMNQQYKELRQGHSRQRSVKYRCRSFCGASRCIHVLTHTPEHTHAHVCPCTHSNMHWKKSFSGIKIEDSEGQIIKVQCPIVMCWDFIPGAVGSHGPTGS